MKYNSNNKSKLERIYKDLGYKVRYEKGKFQSGYAFVQEKKVVIINKFFDAKGRMGVLVDLLWKLPDLNVDELSEESKVFFDKLAKPLEERKFEEALEETTASNE